MRFCSRARLFQAPVSALNKECWKPVRSDLAILDYEADDLTLENLEPSSPGSRELRDFENYNRTALPLLVEANLRAIVDSHIAPIEERVRAMVVDIVRTCQSTVARNFHLTISPTPLANDRARSSSEGILLSETAVHTHEEPAQVSMDVTASTLESFPESFDLNSEASASFQTNSHPESTMEDQNQESYSNHATSLPASSRLEGIREDQNQEPNLNDISLLCSCSCSCHDYSDGWNASYGEKPSDRVSDLQLMRS